MNQPRILFVDDEPFILEALSRLLRSQREQWDMSFALGGHEALAEFQKRPFDVIVSDMRMPGMDGVALLERVKKDYPAAARLVLSGHADPDTVIRVLPVAHQYMSKPFDLQAIRAALGRTCQLRTLLHDEAIRQAVGRLDSLPSLPRCYQELTQLIRREDVGAADVARVVEQDPAIAAKVLQLVNSAFFGLAQRVTSLRQAVTFLGIDLLRGLTLSAHIFRSAEGALIPGLSLEALQRSALLTARLAARLVVNPGLRDEAFSTGIVRDIGKLILATTAGDRFSGVIRIARETARPLHEVEREHFGVTHAEVGAYLLGLWGLPFAMVEAVAYHHTPRLVTDGDRDLLTVVHVGDALAESVQQSDEGGGDLLDTGFLESIGRSAELPAWRTMAAEMAGSLQPASAGC